MLLLVILGTINSSVISENNMKKHIFKDDLYTGYESNFEESLKQLKAEGSLNRYKKVERFKRNVMTTGRCPKGEIMIRLPGGRIYCLPRN